MKNARVHGHGHFFAPGKAVGLAAVFAQVSSINGDFQLELAVGRYIELAEIGRAHV